MKTYRLRLCCERCNAAAFSCPCGVRAMVGTDRALEPGEFPVTVGELRCPRCGTSHDLLIEGYSLNPTGERPATLSDDLERLNRCLQQPEAAR